MITANDLLRRMARLVQLRQELAAAQNIFGEEKMNDVERAEHDAAMRAAVVAMAQAQAALRATMLRLIDHPSEHPG